MVEEFYRAKTTPYHPSVMAWWSNQVGMEGEKYLCKAISTTSIFHFSKHTIAGYDCQNCN